MPDDPQQYPSPYYPPQPALVPYSQLGDSRGPAKRASVLMFILGPMLNMCGFCLIGMPLLMSSLPPDQNQQIMDQIQNTYHVSANVLMPVLGMIILVPGIALFTLAFFVRKGGRLSAILAMVVVGAILLKSLVELPLSLLRPIDANTLAAIFMDVMTLGIFGLLFMWLMQAARASSSVALAQQQYLAQYWQYQQNMQAYSGYGYAAPRQEGQSYPPPVPPAQPAVPPAQNPPEPPSC